MHWIVRSIYIMVIVERRAVRCMMKSIDPSVITTGFRRYQATVWCMRWVDKENKAGGERRVSRGGGRGRGGEEGRRRWNPFLLALRNGWCAWRFLNFRNYRF